MVKFSTYILCGEKNVKLRFLYSVDKNTWISLNLCPIACQSMCKDNKK